MKVCDGDCFHCVHPDCILPIANDKTIEMYTGGKKINYILLRNKGKREKNGKGYEEV